MSPVPAVRLRALVDVPLRTDGDFVLYWMTSFRRPRFNFSLDRAIELAREVERPLVVLEPLRCAYLHASDRLHRFILQGMAANARRFAKTTAHYYPYVEPTEGAGKGLLEALAARACAVVTDDFPCFFLPRMHAAAARKLTTRLESVDSNGLLPMRSTERVFSTAFSFRGHLQKTLAPHLEALPSARPFAGKALPTLDRLPPGVERRWPAAPKALLEATAEALAGLPIDHAIGPAALDGGWEAGTARLRGFLGASLARYPAQRNEPEQDGTSRLSPYLHHGHLSVHQVLAELIAQEGWSLDRLGKSNGGKKAGWWKMSAPAEAFLDQVVTWRELGYNFCSKRDDYDRFESLPPWALSTLQAHAADARPHLYSLAQLERGQTHDPLFNATQTQLTRDGWFHNYLRMLWGKKILEFSSTPKRALGVMTTLMNRYSLDGRNPNSYTGYFWVLGRYDRPWGPERPIFGKVRYMSSQSTARKVRVKGFLERYGSR